MYTLFEETSDSTKEEKTPTTKKFNLPKIKLPERYRETETRKKYIFGSTAAISFAIAKFLARMTKGKSYLITLIAMATLTTYRRYTDKCGNSCRKNENYKKCYSDCYINAIKKSIDELDIKTKEALDRADNKIQEMEIRQKSGEMKNFLMQKLSSFNLASIRSNY